MECPDRYDAFGRRFNIFGKWHIIDDDDFVALQIIERLASFSNLNGQRGACHVYDARLPHLVNISWEGKVTFKCTNKQLAADLAEMCSDMVLSGLADVHLVIKNLADWYRDMRILPSLKPDQPLEHDIAPVAEAMVALSERPSEDKAVDALIETLGYTGLLEYETSEVSDDVLAQCESHFSEGKVTPIIQPVDRVLQVVGDAGFASVSQQQAVNYLAALYSHNRRVWFTEFNLTDRDALYSVLLSKQQVDYGRIFSRKIRTGKVTGKRRKKHGDYDQTHDLLDTEVYAFAGGGLSVELELHDSKRYKESPRDCEEFWSFNFD
jgi:hypothetical protein